MGLKKMLRFSKLLCFFAAAATLAAAPFTLWQATEASAENITVKSIYDGGIYTIDQRFDGYTVKNGIDVSKWQGDINWKGLKNSGTEFAFIRLGYRSNSPSGGIYLDDYFEQNIKAANAAGLPVGVYFYSQAVTEAEARSEAKYCIEKLKGYKIDMPIIMDFEYAWVNGGLGGRLYDAKLSPAQSTKVINAFLDTVSAAGYDSMLYANKSTLSDCINTDGLSENSRVWLAHYTSRTNYAGDYEFWQYSDDGVSEYVSSDSLDCNFWFVPNSAVSVTFSESSASLKTGASYTPTVTVTPGNSSDKVSLTSSDPDVATVINGSVFGISKGTAKITAKTTSGASAEMTVTVSENISGYTASATGSYTYTGKAITPDITLSKQRITSGTLTDSAAVYSLPSASSEKVADAQKGAKLSVKSDTINGYCYAALEDGTNGFVSASLISGETESITLKAGTDYVIEYSGNINVGTATAAAVPLTDTLWGSNKVSFEITAAPLESCTIKDIPEQTYTGAELMPDVEILYNGSALVNGVDYDLSFSDNISVGEANVTITAKGNFSGSASMGFAIVPRSYLYVATSATARAEGSEEIIDLTVSDGAVDTGILNDGVYEIALRADGCVTKKLIVTVLGGLPDQPIDINLYLISDVNNDEKINAKDYALLQRYLNGWDVEFKPE